jgi:bacteriocin biosynthesis cyclodehydratase domain-containing protein
MVARFCCHTLPGATVLPLREHFLMRPALKPGLETVWRNRDTVQIGIDPRRAVALTGMRGAAGLLRLLDGSRDRGQVLAAAGALGMDAATAERVLTLLAAAGALDDFPAGGHGTLPAGARARLAPELATASLAHGDADGGARTMSRRQEACVQVHGGSRAGLWIAGMLTAAGVGTVLATGAAVPRPGPTVARPGPPGAGTPPPAGPGPADCGRPDPGPAGSGPAGSGPAGSGRAGTARGARSRPRHPGLVILADTQQRELPAALVSRAVPHLAAAASEAIGVVGPLVLPGRSACLRCLDLIRAEHDPAWPLILAQLATRPTADPLACDTVLATTVAAQAAAQALAFLDHGAAAAVTNGTLELVLPGWQWRRRTWQPHPDCGCRHPGLAAG